jgi:hypothetical protein
VRHPTPLREQSVIYKVPYAASGGLTTAGKILRGVFGSWQASLIYQLQSGFPFTVSVFGDTANAGSLLNELRHAEPVRQHIAVRDDHRSRNACPADSVRVTRNLLRSASVVRLRSFDP